MTPRERVGRVVVGVIRQALLDSGARALILLDDGEPEARLAAEWCGEAAAACSLPLQRPSGAPGSSTVSVPLRPRGYVLSAQEIVEARTQADMQDEEQQRSAARLDAALLPGGALLAYPANKTALLLSPAAPPEQLLPLGDLYATEVRALTGYYSLPAPVRALAELAGGIDALDAALRAHFDERRRLEEALAPLPEAARQPLTDALAAARFARRRGGLVPKLGARTLGVDLFA